MAFIKEKIYENQVKHQKRVKIQKFPWIASFNCKILIIHTNLLRFPYKAFKNFEQRKNSLNHIIQGIRTNFKLYAHIFGINCFIILFYIRIHSRSQACAHVIYTLEAWKNRMKQKNVCWNFSIQPLLFLFLCIRCPFTRFKPNIRDFVMYNIEEHVTWCKWNICWWFRWWRRLHIAYMPPKHAYVLGCGDRNGKHNVRIEKQQRHMYMYNITLALYNVLYTIEKQRQFVASEQWW